MKMKHKAFGKINLYIIVVILFSGFLNQAGYLFGMNLSISDLILPILIIYMFFKYKYILSVKAVLFFLVVSFSTIFTASYLTPLMFDVTIVYFSIFKEFSKIIIAFLYVSVGYNLLKTGCLRLFLRGYSWTALVIGVIGIVFTTFKVDLFRDSLFFPGGRYDGLMADPNYYAILVTSAVPYFIFNDKISTLKKMMFILVLFLSVLVSGSKTGTITFVIFIFSVIFMKLISGKFGISKLFYVSSVLIIMPLVVIFYPSISEFLSTRIPIVERIAVVFSDFGLSVSEGGSYRDYAYGTAINIIKKSPFFGIGIGTYSEVALAISDSVVIAHNTYLQLFSEWGLFFSSILFINLIYTIVF